MGRKCQWSHAGQIALVASIVLTGCVQAKVDSEQEQRALARTRVIITFNQPPEPNDGRLAELLTSACKCTPLFIRNHRESALVFQVRLTEDETFSGFSQTLLNRGAVLGIRGVEEDGVQRHQ